MHLYNSTFTGWESDLQNHSVETVEATKANGFNCKIPFFKANTNTKINFEFICKQNISIEAGLMNTQAELLVAVEKWYHAGEYTLTMDVINLEEGLHFLSIKSVGKFLVKNIEIIN